MNGDLASVPIPVKGSIKARPETRPEVNMILIRLYSDPRFTKSAHSTSEYLAFYKSTVRRRRTSIKPSICGIASVTRRELSRGIVAHGCLLCRGKSGMPLNAAEEYRVDNA